MIHPLRSGVQALTVSVIVIGCDGAYNSSRTRRYKRLNTGVVANVYTIQHQAGCTDDLKVIPQLQLAAQWHADNVLNNRNLHGDIGSDGSSPQGRANAAGFRGEVSETVAINPALAISGIELINQWYYNPAYFAIMADCAHTQIGVCSVDPGPTKTVMTSGPGMPSWLRAIRNVFFAGPDRGAAKVMAATDPGLGDTAGLYVQTWQDQSATQARRRARNGHRAAGPAARGRVGPVNDLAVRSPANSTMSSAANVVGRP